MVRKAAELASAEDVAELRAIVEQQRAVTGDAAAFVHADMGFHTRIAQITGNPIYSAVSEGMLGWLQEYHAHMLIWQGRVSIDWGVYGVPETFVIGRDGRIAYKQVGAITPEVLQAKILPLIESLRPAETVSSEIEEGQQPGRSEEHTS